MNNNLIIKQTTWKAIFLAVGTKNIYVILEVKDKDHIYSGECSFEDRERQGDGPF